MPAVESESQVCTTLSSAQIADFHMRGYLSLESITTRADILRIQELLEGLFARFDQLPPELALDLGDVKNHRGQQAIPQINTASTFEPRLLDTLYFQNARRVAQRLMNSEVTCTWDHAIYKPPMNGKETPWHQDLAYGVRSSKTDPQIQVGLGCNFWMPLQDVTVDAGCMQFIPYSNHINLLPHHEVGHDPKVHTLETDGVDRSKAVACPIPAGGCTIHSPKTLHYTGPNLTDNWRRVWILFFKPTGTPRTLW